MQVGGVVLCGGESKRMGRSKALLPFGRETMLQRVASVLEKELAPIVIVAAPGQELPELGSDILEVRDEVPGQGPVQALLTGLNVLDESVHCAFVCSCDLPLLTTDFVKFIVDRASPDLAPLGSCQRSTRSRCMSVTTGWVVTVIPSISNTATAPFP